MFGRKVSLAPAGDTPAAVQAKLLDHDLAVWLEGLSPDDRRRAHMLWLHGWYGGFQDSTTGGMSPCPIP